VSRDSHESTSERNTSRTLAFSRVGWCAQIDGRAVQMLADLSTVTVPANRPPGSNGTNYRHVSRGRGGIQLPAVVQKWIRWDDPLVLYCISTGVSSQPLVAVGQVRLSYQRPNTGPVRQAPPPLSLQHRTFVASGSYGSHHGL
jgi:hypothetical protein